MVVNTYNEKALESINNLEPNVIPKLSGKIICLHHNDNDGIFAAKLIKKVYDVDTFIACNYTVKIDEYVKNLAKTDSVIIVDFSLHYKDLTTIMDKVGKVLYMDHHITTLMSLQKNMRDVIERMKDNTLLCNCDNRISGTRIVYESFKSKFSSYLEKAIILIDNYDRFEENTEAFYLNSYLQASFLVSLDNDKFLESILSNKEYLDNAIKYGKRLFDLQRERNQIICSNFAFTTRFEGLNLSVIKGHGNSLLFGDTIKDYDAVCIYYKLPDGRYRYSMYSADNKANVSSICQRYGGGGHIHAAGFTPDTDFFCN